MSESFDVVVLGGGSGLTAAYWAGEDDRSVALVDEKPDALGGTCVNRGCIPTKGLIQTAEVLKTIRSAGRFGISLDQDSVQVDFKAVMEGVRKRRADGASGVKGWVDSAFTPFYSRARFVDDKVLEMEDGTRITGEKIFITAGASPAVPPIPGLGDVSYWTNEEILELEEQPESLLVMGGGYIGVEFAHFFAELGTKVTVVEMAETIAPEDEDVRATFRETFGKKAILLEHHKAAEAFQDGDQVGLVVEDAEGKAQRLKADGLLVAVGRTPNTKDLGLETTGVKTNERGWIEVDANLRTSHPDIYAYGDVIGQGMFKHTSSAEGEVAYRNSQGASVAMEYTANPHAIFSDPQVGGVGLSEEQCRDQGLQYKVAKADYSSVMKGEIIGSPPGFAKLLVEEGSDRILGFHMVGPGAADMVHEVVVAMNAPGAKAQLVRDSIHIHPTVPELIRSVFDQTG